MITAAIVGLGRWGEHLVASVQDGGVPRGPHLRLTRAVVRDPVRAARPASRHGLTLATLSEVLADPAIQAVLIATPHSQHPDQVVAAAGAGKHVFVEKPLALTAAEASRAIAACRAADVVLAVGHNRRFLPAYERLRVMLQQGAIGQVVYAEGLFAGAFGLRYRPGMWRADEMESPAGGLTAMGIHVIDVLVQLLGPVAWVTAQTRRRVPKVPIDDTTVAMMQFAQGVAGHVTCIMATRWAWQLRLFGTKGSLEMDSETAVRWHRRDGASRCYAFPPCDVERAELNAFARAAAGQAPYPVPLEQVSQGVAVLEAVVTSLREGGARVNVP